MELDDLKKTWEEVSNQVQKQQNLSPQIIDRMTRVTYFSGLKKLAYPEIAGAIICVIGAAYICLNFSKLDTFLFQGAGIASIVLLLALPVISLLSLWQFNLAGDANKPYAETLAMFAVQKIRFHKLQRVNLILSYLLLVLVLVLLSKFSGGKGTAGSKRFLIFSLSFGYIFLLFYSKWVLKHYNRILQQTQELLNELKS